MRNARVWGLIAVIIAVMAFPAIALAQPVPPQVFVGSVTQGDVPAPEGTEVTAWIDGAQVGAGTVTDGQYKVLVVQPQDQSFVDKTVTFQAGGEDVPETAIWQVGGASEVNLSAPPIETPTVTTEPTPPEPVMAPTAAPPQPGLISEPVQLDTPVAKAEERSKRRAFVGVVDGEPDATVDVIRNGTNELVTIRLEDYKLKTPGKKAAGSFADGARVVILSQRDGEEWVAIWVMVKPQKLVNRPVVGTVVGVENGVLSIIKPDGTTDTIELPEGTEPPETGEVITLFASDGDAEGEKKGRRKAKGLVKASKIRDRLEGFLQELTTDETGVPENAPSGKLTSARGKADTAQEKALEARAKADSARAKADAAQPEEGSDLNELTLEAEENAIEAEFELAEAESEVAEVEAEVVEEAADAETKAAKRRAKRVSDVASILDALTAQHTEILQSLAEGSILPAEALQGIATALENAKRDRTQATLRADRALARSEEKKQARLAKAEEKREKARARAVEKAEKAQVKAAEKAKKDKAKAARKAERDQAKAARTADRDQAKTARTAERDQAKTARTADRDQAKAAEKAERDQAKATEKAEGDQAKAEQKAERDQADAAGKAGSKPESAGRPDDSTSTSGQGDSRGGKK